MMKGRVLMKKAFLILTALVLLLTPVFACADRAADDDPSLYLPFGILPSDTLAEATEKAHNGTGWEFRDFTSPDKSEMYGCTALPDGQKLMGLPVDILQITSPDKTIPDSTQVQWSVIRISFGEVEDTPAAFAQLYRTLCDIYGEPLHGWARTTEITLDGRKSVDQEILTEDGFPTDAFYEAAKVENDFHASISWYNAYLNLGTYNGEYQFNMSFDSREPSKL